MISGKKKEIAAALENVKDDEPLVLFVGRNPMAQHIVKNFMNRCMHSGRCTDAEIEDLDAIHKTFEQYEPKESSLLFPKEMVDKIKTTTPHDQTPPPKEPEEEEEETKDVEINKQTEEEDDKTVDETNSDNDETTDEGSSDATDEEKDVDPASDAINNLKK